MGMIAMFFVGIMFGAVIADLTLENKREYSEGYRKGYNAGRAAAIRAVRKIAARKKEDTS